MAKNDEKRSADERYKQALERAASEVATWPKSRVVTLNSIYGEQKVDRKGSRPSSVSQQKKR